MKSTTKLPDIIIVLCDTLSANRMSLYGYKKRRTTPELEAMCEGEGFCVFKNCFSSSPWTIPSHASLFTGLYPHQHGTTGESFDRCVLRGDLVTLPMLLKLLTYRTFGISSNPLVNSEIGFDRGFDRFLNLPQRYSRVKDPLNIHTWVSKRKVIECIKEDLRLSFNTRLQSLMDGVFALFKFRSSVLENSYPYTLKTLNLGLRIWKRVDNPVFLFLNLMENHDKYTPPKVFRGFFKNYSEDHIKKQKWWKDYYNLNMDSEDMEMIGTLYDEEVLTLDATLSEFIKGLKKINKKRFENSIVVVISDHGEALGEWGHWGHLFSVYPDTTRVPLLIKFPEEVRVLSEIDKLVMLQDIFATILELVGSGFGAPSGSISFLSNERRSLVVENFWSKWNEEFEHLKKGNFMAFVLKHREAFFYLVEEEETKRYRAFETEDFLNLKPVKDTSRLGWLKEKYHSQNGDRRK